MQNQILGHEIAIASTTTCAPSVAPVGQQGAAPDPDVAKSLLADLIERSRLYHRSQNYKELLDFTSRLRMFAPFNAFLLHVQKPGLRFAASAYDWQQRFHRTVKEGARPLLILWPFGPVAFVYDLNDTEGETPLPDSVTQAFRATGVMTADRIKGFGPRLLRAGISLKLIAYGDAHAGHVSAEPAPEGVDVVNPSTAAKERPFYRVRINSNHEPNVQFATLAHELAHLYLGHLGPDAYLKIANRDRPSHDQRELEAESVSYLVCSRNGVASKAEEYLAEYMKANTDMGKLDLYWILKAAGQIESVLGLSETIRFREVAASIA